MSPRGLVLPTTGVVYEQPQEILPDIHTFSTPELAYVHGALTDLKHELDRARNAVEVELADRVDQALAAGEIDGNTLHEDGFSIAVTSSPQYRDEELRADLLEHADELNLGLIRLADLFAVRHTLRRREYGALAQRVPALVDYLERYRKATVTRKVTVKRPLTTPLPPPPPAPTPLPARPAPAALDQAPAAEDEW